MYLAMGSNGIGIALAVWIGLVVVLSLIRLAINLLFFVKFSLWTMYAVILSLGGFIAIGVGFPGWGPVFAIQGGGLVIIITSFCISLYEPKDGKIFDPEFKYKPRTKEEMQKEKWQPPE